MTRFRRRVVGATSVVAVAAMLGAGATIAPFAAEPITPDVPVERFDRSYAPLVEKVMPAVVNVAVERERPAQTTGAPVDPEMRRFFERFFGQPFPFPEQPPQRDFRMRGEGSGFIIDADGHIVTNAHVAGDADKITVVMHDGTEYDAKLVGVDEKTDLAVIKVDAGEPLPFVSWGDSDNVKVGDKVLAVGNPFGLGGTVTAGIISATGRELGAGPYDDFIQTDAPINRGNSGGPTFDLDGKVVGVNSMIFSPSGGSVGIGFAISANLAKEVAAELIAKGHVERGWLGVSIQTIDEDLANALGLEAEQGALVSGVEPGSPAENAGIKTGDVIVEFDGTRIERLRDLTFAVAEVDPGTKANVTLLRDGERQTLEVEVGRMPGAEEIAAATDAGEEGEQPRLGLSLAPITPEVRQRLDLPADVGGVLVQEVQPDSPAAEKGLRAGDILLQVGGEAVRSPDDVLAQVRAAQESGDDTVLLLVRRNGQQLFTAVPLAVS